LERRTDVSRNAYQILSAAVQANWYAVREHSLVAALCGNLYGVRRHGRENRPERFRALHRPNHDEPVSSFVSNRAGSGNGFNRDRVGTGGRNKYQISIKTEISGKANLAKPHKYRLCERGLSVEVTGFEKPILLFVNFCYFRFY